MDLYAAGDPCYMGSISCNDVSQIKHLIDILGILSLILNRFKITTTSSSSTLAVLLTTIVLTAIQWQVNSAHDH